MSGVEPRSSAAFERLVSQFGTFYFDEQHHRMSLPLLARWLMVDDRPQEALNLLLRYWRTGPDGVPDRLLEATLRRRLDGPEAALPALRRAYAVDPTDPGVQARLLNGLVDAARSEEARDVALRLLRSARDPEVLLSALAVSEPDWSFFGQADLDRSSVDGWCIWRGGEPWRRCLIVADGRSAEIHVEDERHPVWTPSGVRFGRFRLAWPAQAAIVSVEDAETGRTFRGTPLMNDEILDDGRPAGPDEVEVTIVVPVYADAQATRRCFESLAADRVTRTTRRIVAVDDASPDPMIRALLDRLASAGRITLLRNPQNVGFIRAVNRALKLVRQEDVVLLNADTMVPPGWLDRLRDAALEPDVGTVTPLSNNGEFVSVPAPFRPNPMPDYGTLKEVDRAVQRLGTGSFDMPNGVGFCLYIRNDALRAVGGLDARHYERGYLEEVDFCLRVAAAGYRNICTTGLFVAHQGEASFGASKRELVMANASALVRRWPRIETETEAFVKADPLRGMRGALAWACLARVRRRLVITLGAPVGRAVIDRVAADAAGLSLAILNAPDPDPASWRVSLDGLDEPPALPADVAGLSAEDALAALTQRLGVDDVLLCLPQFSAGHLSADHLAAGLTAIGLPVDLFPVEDGWRVPEALRGRGRRLLLASEAVRAPDVVDAARCVLPRPVLALPRAAPGNRGQAMGIIAPDATAATYALVRDLGRALHRRGSSLPLIVLGETFRDVGLLRLGNVFVTGALAGEEDWREALAAHPCAGLMLPLRQPLLMHEGFDVIRAAGLPFAAYRTGGAADLLDEVPGGLALDPAWSPDQLALVIDTFLSATLFAGLRRSLPDAA
jgi:GT2 family glycosyltransferase